MIEPRTAKATQARVKKGKEFSEGILKILKEHPTGVTLYRLSKLHQSSPGATLGAIERISNKIISKERAASKIIKILDSPKTPFERLLSSDDISKKTKKELTKTRNRLNPFKLQNALNSKIKNVRCKFILS